LKELGNRLDKTINEWVKKYGKEIEIYTEPGRYISAECGLILGRVNAVKKNYNNKYIGTDLGFNVLMRTVLYDNYHDIEIYRKSIEVNSEKRERVIITGNICESGDMITDEREFKEIFENDLIGILDAGAYGYVMSSNYNNRLRPAEVLIKSDGNERLIRKRDRIEDLMINYKGL